MSVQKQNRKSGDTEGLCLASALSDSFVCGVIVVNQQEKIASCSPEAARFLRLDPDATTGSSMAVLPVKVQEMIRSVIKTAQPVSDRTIGVPAGGTIALHVSAVPLPVQSSTHVVIVINDISIARQLEDNVRRLDRLASIGTLSAGVGHEIKNALVPSRLSLICWWKKTRTWS